MEKCEHAFFLFCDLGKISEPYQSIILGLFPCHMIARPSRIQFTHIWTWPLVFNVSGLCFNPAGWTMDAFRPHKTAFKLLWLPWAPLLPS